MACPDNHIIGLPSRAHWTRVVSVPVTVLSANEPAVQLIHDPTILRPFLGEIEVRSLRFIRTSYGSQLSPGIRFSGNTCPLSFKVFLRVSGKEYPLGYRVVGPSGKSNGGNIACTVRDLDPALKCGDLIFRPDPVRAIKVIGIDHIWGDTVVLQNVPFERFDLPATQPIP